MAIAPANVLISDPGAEWMKIGVPLVLQQDLMSSQFISPAMVSDESNIAEVGAQDILRIKLEDRQGKIHIGATVVDAKTQKTTATEDLDATMATLIPALDKLAKNLDPSAGEFSTKNTDALKLLTAAGSEQHPQERFELLKKATTTDPNFGMAQFFLIQMIASSGQNNFQGPLAEAKTHLANFPPYEKARFQFLASQLERAPLSQRSAAIENLHKVAPNDLDALSMVANLRFLNGDTNAGTEALNKAIQLNPGNANLKVELAEGLVQAKRFADAEKVLAKLDKNPASLVELAQVILLEGDVKRASDTAEKFIAALPNADSQNLVRATWAQLSGDKSKALTLAETTKFTVPQIQGMALAEATVWQLQDKDLAGARKTADLGMKASAQPTPFTILSSLLVSGDQSADDRRKRVDASQANPAMKQTILAYGFFLNGHYPEAVAEWEKAYDATEGADLRVRAMYASSLDKAGNSAEAQKIKVQPYLMRDVRELADVYGTVAYVEMKRLTGLQR